MTPASSVAGDLSPMQKKNPAASHIFLSTLSTRERRSKYVVTFEQ